VIQIPVFFSLYKVLYITIEMRQAPFILWIRDLSLPDPTTITNLFGLLPFTPPPTLFGVVPLHVLGVFPIIMGLTMFLQTKMNPPPPDPMQEKIFLFMPVLFTFMMGGFPAGLVIYWTWNNTLSILQQYFIQTRMGVSMEWDKKFPTFFSLVRKLRGRPPVKTLSNGSSKQPGE
jgi:YidC/Oxa1 family membrane protein insertase